MFTKEQCKTIPLPISTKQEFHSLLDDIAREGARQLLIKALNIEVEDYISKYSGEGDENGHRLVVRNGKAKPRTITVGSGSFEISAPRVDDRARVRHHN